MTEDERNSKLIKGADGQPLKLDPIKPRTYNGLIFRKKRVIPTKDVFNESKEPRGVDCERCGRLTENIECIHGFYWVCPGCARIHRTLEAAWKKPRED